MDAHNLLFFTMAKMDTSNSASCGQTPVAVSSRSKSGSGSTKTPKTSTKQPEDREVQKDMSVNVGRIGDSMHAVAFANLASQRESLQEKKFNLEIRHMDCDNNVAMQELIKRRISQIDETLKQVNEELEGVSAIQPKRIRFSHGDVPTMQIGATAAMTLSTPPAGAPC